MNNHIKTLIGTLKGMVWIGLMAALIPSCQNSSIVGKNFSKVFEGRLENRPEFSMKIISTEKKISGSYFYVTNPDEIPLKGDLLRSDSLILSEFDKEGNLTGIFKGKFKNSSRVEGVWTKPNGTNPASFYLNETNFKYEGLLSAATSKRDSVLKEQHSKKMAEEALKQSAAKIEQDKKAMNSKISEFLAVTSNKNTPQKSKGIEDLKITVKNNSNYPFDRVIVDVNYFDKKGEVVKTQTAEFTDLKPADSQTRALPDTKVGLSVKYFIRKAISSAIQYSYK
ncbi:MAG: FxLYD domain-containing protein [Bacteroidales bacterium]